MPLFLETAGFEDLVLNLCLVLNAPGFKISPGSPILFHSVYAAGCPFERTRSILSMVLRKKVSIDLARSLMASLLIPNWYHGELAFCRAS